MEVNWTKNASDNLVSISNFISIDNPVRAKSFILEILEKTKTLESFPNIGRESSVYLGTRELIINKNYLLTYIIWSDRIDIIQVWHTRYNRENK